MASVAFLGTGLLGGAMVEGMLRRGDGDGLESHRGEGARARAVRRKGGGHRRATRWPAPITST